MGRAVVRELKQAARLGARPDASTQERDAGRTAALALLERSIRLQHDRVAILRLTTATRLGADVSDEQLRYCEEANERLVDAARRREIHDAAGSAINGRYTE